VESVFDSLPPGSRVAVIRLRSLGDCVLTTPALDILKRFRPDLRLAVVVEDRFRAVFKGNPDIDEILPPDLAALRRFRPDLTINFHGGTRSAWMTALSGARYRAGFGHYRHQFPYNVRIPRAQEILGVERKAHTAEHLASAVFFLGAPQGEIPRAKLVAPGTDDRPLADARGSVRSAAAGTEGGQAASGRRNTAVLHPVAAATEKTWPAVRFLQVAVHLRATGLDPVFVGAPSDDLSAFTSFRTLQASLAELKGLLARAVLFVGNDSGPAHMAAAFGLPVVVFFGASDREVWAPWRTASEVLPLTATAETAINALARLRVAA
jgi:ADP-heptose:LPS heptosyltransferase